MERSRVRNFCIIAHIDHGKSTLADRLLEACGLLSPEAGEELVLDSMELEREKGITIKSSAVRLRYTYGGELYELNLIDTPGHVDFSYEVSRALTACEGAVVLVDVSQGVEAQTVSNVYMALDHDLRIIPVVNKIDLTNFNPEIVAEEIVSVFGFERDEILFTSGKTGEGVEELLAAIIERIPPPQDTTEDPLRALIFDAHFDQHRGVVVYTRLFGGQVKAGDQIVAMASGKEFTVQEVGVFSPEPEPVEALSAGEVGYVIAGIKNVRDSRVGDTLTSAERPAPEALPGYREPTPMVFCGLYPTSNDQYQALRDALEKLSLNDAALRYEPETSAALGFGFRCGFLGLLHMEIVQERLEREYDLELIATAPSVVYRILLRDGTLVEVDNPAHFPDRAVIEVIEEPVVEATIMTPQSYVGACIEVSNQRRGELLATEYLYADRVALRYRLPLAEIIVDYFDQLKTLSRGYATLDYELAGYQEADVVKIDILVNGDSIDALAVITHRQGAQRRAREIIHRLRKVIPRQLFRVRLQAAIGGRVIAAQDIPPLRKDVLEKCYGGDV
ncbi:MAG: translation elongation factor 4, partial [Armatimonadetes bacterium]|nr:translation elongation factor 4 [Armatimonadota bacterium]